MMFIHLIMLCIIKYINLSSHYYIITFSFPKIFVLQLTLTFVQSSGGIFSLYQTSQYHYQSSTTGFLILGSMDGYKGAREDQIKVNI